MLKPLIVSSILILQSGLPFSVLGQGVEYGAMLTSAIIVLSILISIFRGKINHKKETYYISGLFLFYVIQSFISNEFIYGNKFEEWGPSFYILAPILIIWTLSLFEISEEDIVNGFLYASVFAAILLVMDQFFKFPFLDIYKRVAFADSALRRIVLLKNEIAISFVITFAKILNTKSPKYLTIYGSILVLNGYVLVVLQESRLAIASTFFGCSIYVLFFFKSRYKYWIVFGLSVVSLISLPILLRKYIDYISGIGDLRVYDPSVSMRIIEMGHFGELFSQTGGIGIGQMSISPDKSNVLAFSLKQASYLYDKAGATMMLNDLGYLAALYQFGYLGIILVIGYTLFVVYSLWIHSLNTSADASVGGGVFVSTLLGFQMNPIPLNIFSLDWTVLLGGFFWYLTALKKGEDSILSNTTRTTANRP